MVILIILLEATDRHRGAKGLSERVHDREVESQRTMGMEMQGCVCSGSEVCEREKKKKERKAAEKQL